VRSVRATYKYRRERGRWLSRWSSKEERRKRKEIEKNLDLLGGAEKIEKTHKIPDKVVLELRV